ncbi:MAG: ATP-NAD kinase family protein [Thermoplasmata archaeon]|nr:ATP-NAD kinase family protein [Thermoplasmata archaeon]
MFKLGFLINPIAGMGGAVGLKGTDGVLAEALNRGAQPLASERATKALVNFQDLELEILTCSGPMGEAVLKELGLPHQVVYNYEGDSTAEDTVNAVKIFLEHHASFILFCGGDGTARDVYRAAANMVPMLGIPAGVKMHSAIFAVNPKIVGTLVKGYAFENYPLKDAEIMDIDEDDYRDGRLSVKLFGYAEMPYQELLVQSSKQIYQVPGESDSKEAIAKYVLELMEDDAVYIMGAGSTVKAVGDALGIDKSLLGVDVVKNGQILQKDASEKEIMGCMGDKPKIIVSLIGAQGFIFGRGTQQISSKIIKKVGKKNLIIIATPYKLFHTPELRVDTNDEELDKELEGYFKLISGYHQMTVRKIVGSYSEDAK